MIIRIEMSIQTGDIVESSVVTQFNSVAFIVNHETRRVTIMSYKNEPVKFHVFNQHDTDPELMKLQYHYPGLASSIELPKITHMRKVRLMVFDQRHRMLLAEEFLLEKLYFVHHHYAKYYVYGLVPVVVKNFRHNLYIGAPVFDETGKVLLSVVSDCYFSSTTEENCVIPLSGELSGSRGVLCLDGHVWLNETGDDFTFDKTNVPNRIDLYISHDKKFIYLNVFYNNYIINFIRVKAKFVGNVLIR
ncbi:P26b [Chrysodeixis includens nucleopolyhedrovirus]|uniref:p26b n=1 Tax=Chrysodeixis includens nucleopolyhedrovirus TaxID=1207438 RepID=A0A1C8ZXT2_9ABAC|nr:P26b [Chrysodeixis includens nucleopolyhedrovirus]AOL56640.1 P26b [Chrysodeixis includens nucleopolyhedrovirus]AOL56781.1 P26b [Chrysodeixis includens nucleopolyhedrovirus]AOL56923.1 P26b [Chrysodeixis includens nucleopolyhedrovirus]AOL57065.1 P26b [Chrysodeixis includens nucleopolyhedrovirus]